MHQSKDHGRGLRRRGARVRGRALHDPLLGFSEPIKLPTGVRAPGTIADVVIFYRHRHSDRRSATLLIDSIDIF
jgi:hypothetical protein